MNNISIDQTTHTIYCQLYVINPDTFTHLRNEMLNYEQKIAAIYSGYKNIDSNYVFTSKDWSIEETLTKEGMWYPLSKTLLNLPKLWILVFCTSISIYLY